MQIGCSLFQLSIYWFVCGRRYTFNLMIGFDSTTMQMHNYCMPFIFFVYEIRRDANLLNAEAAFVYIGVTKKCVSFFK